MKRAFVVMQFKDGDNRFKVIEECLDEAGYEVVRADKVKTSGYVVGEMCRDLETADLIVIDTSGNSLNVAYELGYSHGFGRAYEDIFLIREGNPDAIPFDYRQFRHQLYKNLRELRKKLRNWFDICEPLSNSQTGYILNFYITPEDTEYGFNIANAIVRSLEQMHFSGRCECYAADVFLTPNLYIVGIGLRSKKKQSEIKADWWQKFVRYIESYVEQEKPHINIDLGNSELGEMSGMRTHLVYRGSAEFEKGFPRTILNIGHADSWFISAINEALEKRGDAELD